MKNTNSSFAHLGLEFMQGKMFLNRGTLVQGSEKQGIRLNEVKLGAKTMTKGFEGPAHLIHRLPALKSRESLRELRLRAGGQFSTCAGPVTRLLIRSRSQISVKFSVLSQVKDQ